MSEQPATATRACCGRPTLEECRCYTDAAGIAAAIRAFVARRARTPHDVEDITQETLLRLYRSAPSLRDEQALEGWMYRIARTAIVDHYRRATVRPQPVDPEQADLRWQPKEPDAVEAEQSLAACLTPLLDRIPDTYRTALELTDRALSANLEVGVVLKDPHVVRRLTQHFAALMNVSSGPLVPLG